MGTFPEPNVAVPVDTTQPGCEILSIYLSNKSCVTQRSISSVSPSSVYYWPGHGNVSAGVSNP